MYHWCHLELKNFFGYEGVLNSKTAEEVWNLCNAKLAAPEFSARGLIKASNVAMIGTIDDPCSDLKWHKLIAEDKSFETKVCPSFRPDPALNCHKAGFAAYIEKLSAASGIKIEHAADVAAALTQRIDYFDTCGYRASDQGTEVPGKIQHGSAWWFNDNKVGMQDQMISLGQLGILGNFIGMLTDSRSFLSYARHEYFRRILCELIGGWVENGEYPADMEFLGQIVEDISANNALRYFNI